MNETLRHEREREKKDLTWSAVLLYEVDWVSYYFTNIIAGRKIGLTRRNETLPRPIAEEDFGPESYSVSAVEKRDQLVYIAISEWLCVYAYVFVYSVEPAWRTKLYSISTWVVQRPAVVNATIPAPRRVAFTAYLFAPSYSLVVQVSRGAQRINL